VGKTTLVKRLVNLATGRFVGFWTEEVREGGRRVGFKIITTDGREALLAHVNITSPWRVGRYGVDVEGFERLVVPMLEACLPQCSKILVIDEIGKMELLSERFARLVEDIVFGGERDIVATIPIRDVHPLVRRIRETYDPILLTPLNREEMFRRVAEMLLAHIRRN